MSAAITSSLVTTDLTQQDLVLNSLTPKNAIAFGMSDLLTNSTQTWLESHPTLNWILVHPLWSVGLALLLVFLFWGLLKAIAQFIEKLWLQILLAPFKLGQQMVKLVTPTFKHAADPKPTYLETDTGHDRLVEILLRLEALKQEQDTLLQEVKTILSLEKSP